MSRVPQPQAIVTMLQRMAQEEIVEPSRLTSVPDGHIRGLEELEAEAGQRSRGAAKARARAQAEAKRRREAIAEAKRIAKARAKAAAAKKREAARKAQERKAEMEDDRRYSFNGLEADLTTHARRNGVDARRLRSLVAKGHAIEIAIMLGRPA